MTISSPRAAPPGLFRQRLQGARPNDNDHPRGRAADPSQAVEVEPKVRGESRYDKVTSFLMAVVLGAILVVGWLALVYASNQAYASRVTAPLADHRGRRGRRQSRGDAGLDGKNRRRGGRRGGDGFE